MPDDLPGEIKNTPAKDDNAAPSTAPEAKAPLEGELVPKSEADASAAEKPSTPPKGKTAQERINQLTRKGHERDQENARLLAENEELKTQKSPAKTPEVSPAPKEDDFDTLGEFEAAKAEHIAKTASDMAYERISKEKQEETDTTLKNERKTSLKAKKKVFDAAVESKRDGFENFEEVAYGHDFMDTDLVEQILDMEKGPEIAYHLGSNLDIAKDMIALSPVQRARELTKLEFSLETLKPKLVSDAPDPITPLGNSETVEKDPDKMSADEWRDWRNNDIRTRAAK
ncbi:MAG: hypothetical protein JKY53_00215 [Flavobacteriales bacterium]|nr:hypothetical protein [Flavobacteriales bacterium]